METVSLVVMSPGPTLRDVLGGIALYLVAGGAAKYDEFASSWREH